MNNDNAHSKLKVRLISSHPIALAPEMLRETGCVGTYIVASTVELLSACLNQDRIPTLMERSFIVGD